MIGTVIIDDEPDSRKTISNIITNYCDDVEILGEAEDVASGTELIKTTVPQLVFLDIKMPDGSGFKVLENCINFTFSVVFVTAFHQYAIKAFRFSAIDYILKPVNPQQLILAVNKAKTLAPDFNQIPERINTLLYNREELKKIALPTLNGYRFVKVETIIRCEANNNYTTFFLTNGETIMVTRTLKEYEELLTNKGFLRVHQSHLINLAHVEQYFKGEGGVAVMSDGSQVSISRRKKELFLKNML